MRTGDKGLKTRFKKNQASKPKALLASTEDEARNTKPDEVRVGTAGAEPKPVAAASNVEHAKIAIGVFDGLHHDPKPLTVRLIEILLPKGWTDFCRTEITDQLDGVENLRGSRLVLARELLDRRDAERDVFFGLCQRKRRFAENVLRPGRSP
jgi:hypothetical protein